MLVNRHGPQGRLDGPQRNLELGATSKVLQGGTINALRFPLGAARRPPDGQTSTQRRKEVVFPTTRGINNMYLMNKGQGREPP